METLIDRILFNPDLNINHMLSNPGAILWVAIIILAFYFLKKQPFDMVSYYLDRKDKHYNMAIELLDSEKLSKDDRELLTEALGNGVFYKYFKINANATMRSCLLRLSQEHSETLNWTIIKRAYPYLSPSNGSIVVKFDFYDHINKWLCKFATYIIIIYATLIILFGLFQYEHLGQLRFFSLTGVSLLLISAAALFSSLNFPYQSAIKIKRCIEANHV